MKNLQIKIGNRIIGDDHPVFIIAEAGVNNNGKIELAKKMIDVAKRAGADAVKFQTFRTENFVIQNAPKAIYQKKITKGKSQFEMLKKLELSFDEFNKLFNYCKMKKIIFLSTPFDMQSAEFLHKLGVAAFKIGSGDLTNIPLLLQIAKYGKPIILSTGMSTMAEIKDAVKAIYSAKNKKLILLQCTSSYPAEFNDVNLSAMNTLRKKLNVSVGYSDHTKGIEISTAAVAMGATVIEKHFTLGKNQEGPDHKISLIPNELKDLINSIRNVEKAFGDGMKQMVKSEREIRRIARKSIVASCDIPKGMIIEECMLAIKRPGIGIEPKYFKRLIGKKAKRIIKKNQVFTWGIL